MIVALLSSFDAGVAGWMPHLILAPILLPLFTGAVMVFLGERRHNLKAALGIGATALGLLVAIALLRWADQAGGPHAAVGVYLPGNWRAPFGIALVLDRLSALMLVLASGVALASAVFAAARWHRAGVHYQPLFQFQLMGLYGAFLTGDLFNLFVFFEIMLAASYGLLLHGSGRPRVAAGLHYIAINLAASALFLVGVSLLYGVTGTLNMADMAAKIAAVAPADRGLLHAGAAILAVAFFAKAALWPLGFWLVPAYQAATAPVGALFAIMTKVGVYAVLRLSTLLFSPEAGASAGFGGSWVFAGGLATLAFGAIGMLGSQKLGRLAGYGVVASSGTLLAATGLSQAALTGGALYYLLSSTLAACLLFLLVDLVERWRNDGATIAPHEEADHAPFLGADLRPMTGLNLDDDETALVGHALPGTTALLGLAFVGCTLLIAGLPPLSGFVGKFAMLHALLNPDDGRIGTRAWSLLALLIGSGLFAMLALSRAGIRHFWAVQGRGAPLVRPLEGLPVAALLLACVLLTLQAGPVLRYTQATAEALQAPRPYIEAVLGAQPRSAPPAGAAGAGSAAPAAGPTGPHTQEAAP